MVMILIRRSGGREDSGKLGQGVQGSLLYYTS